MIFLFALSLILVGITIYRVIAVIDRHSDQQFRSLVASLEILAAAAVSNALVLGSFVRDRGAKKQRFRFGSVGGSSLDRAAVTRRGALTERNWGSDADLVGDIGLRLGPELQAQAAIIPRPAPIASPLAAQAKNSTLDLENPTWNPSNPNSTESATTDIKSALADYPPSPSSTTTPRQASFFDIGGLLDDDGTPTLPRYQTPMNSRRQQPKSHSRHHPRHTEADEFAIQHSKQGGSNALLQDIGGLLSSEPAQGTSCYNSSSPTTKKQPPRSTLQASGSTQRRQDNLQLRDVGGLLN